MDIKILFEDKDLLVINKPAGISVHPAVEQAHYGTDSDGKTKSARNASSTAGAGGEKTITDWVLEKYPRIKNVGEPIRIVNSQVKSNKVYKVKRKNNFQLSTFNFITIQRPGIVHRLDKETSGVLLIAKNQKTFEFLKKQFENHKIKKVYQAFVYGSVSDPRASLATNKRGVINVPIGRSPLDIRMWTAGRAARPPLREAITEYVVLKRFKDLTPKPPLLDKERGQGGEVDSFSFLELYPKTGRTHQIRVHLRYINHPIVSDPLYRGTKDLALGMKRLALHAKSINFQLPNGEPKNIEAPYPADFEKILEKYIK